MKKELDKRRFKIEALIFFSQLLLKMLVQLSGSGHKISPFCGHQKFYLKTLTKSALK